MENIEDFRGLEEVQEEEVVEEVQEDNTEDLKQIIEQNNEKIDLLVDSLVNSEEDADTSATTLAVADVEALLLPIQDKLDNIYIVIYLIAIFILLNFCNSCFSSYFHNARLKK